MDLAITINRPALKPALLDLAGNGLVLFASGRQRIGAPRVKPAGVDIQNLTHQSNRVLLRMIFNEGVPHPDCFAKYAAAFFNMSRSSVPRRSSASSFLIRPAWSSLASRSSVGTPYRLTH
jgi:hypothetical protein